MAKNTAAGALERMTLRLQQILGLGQMALALSKEGVTTPVGEYQEWRLASMSYLETTLGPANRYYKFFAERISPQTHFSSTVDEGLGILRAVKGELEFGPLPNFEGLISGRIFEDFLDMAQHLLDENYIEVVPSLVGAVLEDGLRRIARNHDIPVREDSENITSLNTKLADNNIYTNFIRKKVVVWAAVRNNADHGKFADNSEQDVRQMLDGVRDFLNTHLT
jgi:hypothetical protein